MTETFLSEGWTLVLTEPDVCHVPVDVGPMMRRIAASVPGTVAEALEAAGQFDRSAPKTLDTHDAWYVCHLGTTTAGPAVLRFAGLATVAEVFLNGVSILQSRSMFLADDVPVIFAGGDTLAICFRALAPHLAAAGPRARWRPQIMDSQGLRLLRTTALGHMPGWCPSVQAVGPWRPISVLRPEGGVDGILVPPAQTASADAAPGSGFSATGAFREASDSDDWREGAATGIFDLALSAELEVDGSGVLRLSFAGAEGPQSFAVSCGGESQDLVRGADGRFAAELRLADVRPWWPNTHGTPDLYEVTLLIDGVAQPLGRTGFRRVAVARGHDGQDFGLEINGVPVFCRGAVWTTADIVRLPGGRADYAPWLQLAVEAGMNMIRIGGTMAYETPEFFALCDELGLMVWQELMLANFDYPVKDEGFVEQLCAEVEQLLAATRASPSLVVLCGGSEVYQQAAMMGLPERIWKGPLTEEIVPEIAARLRPDIVYVANSPSGGAMPFAPNAGVTHYYGVGAYCRPLDDARRADVRFAAESLAFAHVPQQVTLDVHLPVPPVHDPRWKARVPRDRSASWDFEDVRDHYLGELYGVEPARLRREDAGRYLDLSRAVTGEVIEATYSEWRRPGSGCHGALVWTLQDLLPGPGWGVIDATGLPKPVWYGLRRAFRPLQLLLTDESTNGLDVHVINETAAPRHLVLELTCLRAGQHSVVNGRRELVVPARSGQTLAATDLFGAFFDTTYAFRFGPPSHDATVARLTDRDSGTVVAEAFHFPQGRSAAMFDAVIAVSLLEEDGHWWLELTADRLAQSVHISVDGFRPDDDWFHLAPGSKKRVQLLPLAERTDAAAPSGEVRTVGSRPIVRF